MGRSGPSIPAIWLLLLPATWVPVGPLPEKGAWVCLFQGWQGGKSWEMGLSCSVKWTDSLWLGRLGMWEVSRDINSQPHLVARLE